jgi:hypothetical protein
MATITPLTFNPTSISGCQWWLDSADSSRVLLSGVNVTQWNDKSGNSRNAVFSLSNYATRVSINSGVSFSNSYYTTTYTADPTNESLFIAFRSQSASNRIMLSPPNPNGRFVGIPDTGTTPSYSIGFGKDAITWGATVPITSNANVLTTIQFSSGSFSRISANGGTFSNYTALSFNSGSNTNIGGAISGGNVVIPYVGIIYEIIAYNSVLSSNNMQQVEGYLAWKWGLQGSLPTTHPFYYAAPNNQGLTYPVGLRIPAPIQSFQGSSSPFVFFNPRTVSGVVLWLDAIDPNGTGIAPAGGATLSNWIDKSGISNNATGGIATYQTNRLFGLPGIVFAGNTAYTLAKPGSLSIGQSQGSSLFVVVQSSGATSTEQAIFAQSPSNPGACDKTGRILYFETAVTTLAATMYCGFAGTTNAYSVNQVALVSDLYTNTGVGNYTHNTFLNGTAFTTTGTTVTGANTSATIAHIGTLNVGSPNLNGVIYEILYYNSTLSTNQRQLIEGYLAWKWGLQGSLPSNHPFRNAPPGLTMPTPVLTTRVFQQATFSPLRISGLQLWLDGQDPTATGIAPTTGQTIATWVDKSGNGKDALATGTPTYLSGGGVSLNGTNAYYRNTSFTYDLSKRSVFIVLKVNTYLANAGVLPFIPNPSSGSDGTTTTGLSIETVTNVLRVYGNTGGYFSDIPNTSLTTVNLYNDNMNGTVGSQFLNGTQSGNPSATYTAGSTSGYVIGARWLSGAASTSYLLTGNIYEILLFTGPLTTNQRQSVEGYLAWKWGLQGSLPANHPFKNFSPPPN